MTNNIHDFVSTVVSGDDLVLFCESDEEISRAHFVADIIAARTVIRRHDAKRWAIYYEDDYRAFATGLVALLSLGAEVFIPSTIEPAFIASLGTEVDACLGDFPEGVALMPSDAATSDDDIEHLLTAVRDVDEPRLVIFTSGSTGEPKKIEKRLDQVLAELRVLEDTWGTTTKDVVFLSSVSQQHIYGLLFSVLWPLVTGKCIHATRLANVNSVRNFILSRPEHERFVWVSSPAHLKRMSDDMDWPMLARRVVEIFSSGAALPAGAVEFLARHYGRSALEIYGSSETGGIATRRQLPGEDTPWTPFASVECRAGSEGRLEIRSPYLPDSGWYLTDDVAEFTSAAAFRLAGRSDQLVKVEGKRISLARVQAALTALPEVDDAHVLPSTGDGKDLLCAVAVLGPAALAVLARHGKQNMVQRLRRQLAPNLEALAIPRRWRFVPVIPVNVQGKRLSSEMHAMFEAPTATRHPELLGSFVQEDDHCFILSVPEHLVYFDGHFDSAAILAGVVQISWAVMLGTDAFSIDTGFTRMEAVKFTRLVRPNDILKLTMRFDAAGPRLFFAYAKGDEMVSSGRIVFGSPGNSDDGGVPGAAP